MTSTTRVGPPAVPAEAPHRGVGAAILDVFRDPVRTFVVLALCVGGYLVFAVPYFGGIDEPAHFYRTYQISTGQFVPEKVAGSKFSGACIPADVVRDVTGYQRAYARHLKALTGPAWRRLGTRTPEPELPCPDPGDRFRAFSTFGSPLPYAPQTVAVLVARGAGADAGVLLVVGRLALLAAYVVVVAFAIRRSPRARWGLAATALVPVAVFQSASSLSHDAMTTAVAILVVSSALRALDPPARATVRSLVIEAALLSVLLGMCKPVYIVIAGCYLLPLLGSPERRARLWGLVPAAALGVLLTVVWNEIVGDLWRTDSTYFGIRPDPPERRHELITAPWHFAMDALRTVPDQLWDWVKGLVGVGPSVTNWPAFAVVVVALLFISVALQHDRDEPSPLRLAQRGLVLLLFVLGVALVFAANYVYWTTPGNDVITGVQARYFVPLLVLLPVIVGTPPLRWLGARTARVPVGVLLVPFFVVFAASVTFRMY
jgi:hypothetical protein